MDYCLRQKIHNHNQIVMIQLMIINLEVQKNMVLHESELPR